MDGYYPVNVQNAGGEVDNFYYNPVGFVRRYQTRIYEIKIILAGQLQLKWVGSPKENDGLKICFVAAKKI